MLHELQSRLLEGCYTGEYVGDYIRGYQGGYVEFRI